jgi:hypothetical protein
MPLQQREEKTMVPPQSATLRDDAEFDLDVRLQSLTRHISTGSPPSEQGCPDYPVTEVSCVSCKPPCLE